MRPGDMAACSGGKKRIYKHIMRGGNFEREDVGKAELAKNIQTPED